MYHFIAALPAETFNNEDFCISVYHDGGWSLGLSSPWLQNYDGQGLSGFPKKLDYKFLTRNEKNRLVAKGVKYPENLDEIHAMAVKVFQRLCASMREKLEALPVSADIQLEDIINGAYAGRQDNFFLGGFLFSLCTPEGLYVYIRCKEVFGGPKRVIGSHSAPKFLLFGNALYERYEKRGNTWEYIPMICEGGTWFLNVKGEHVFLSEQDIRTAGTAIWHRQELPKPLAQAA